MKNKGMAHGWRGYGLGIAWGWLYFFGMKNEMPASQIM